jgi:hypothetical protein
LCKRRRRRGRKRRRKNGWIAVQIEVRKIDIGGGKSEGEVGVERREVVRVGRSIRRSGERMMLKE